LNVRERHSFTSTKSPRKQHKEIVMVSQAETDSASEPLPSEDEPLIEIGDVSPLVSSYLKSQTGFKPAHTTDEGRLQVCDYATWQRGGEQANALRTIAEELKKIRKVMTEDAE
jgi:hypothetical protein